jgi:hypothetical protein
MNKNILSFTIVTLLLCILIFPSIDSNCVENDIYRSNNKNNSLSYDYGLKAGGQYRFQYKIINFFSSINYREKINDGEVQEIINSMEQYSPLILNEMKGLSDSIGISLNKLVKLKIRLTSQFRESCTSLAATGNATKNDETFVMQNIDPVFGAVFSNILWRILTYKLRVRHNTLKYKYAYFGIPILVEIPIINEKGLGWSGATVSITKDEERSVDGGPGMWGGGMGYAWNQLVMMNCKNVSEIGYYYSDPIKPKTEGYFWSDTWCDREGGILNSELTYNHLALVYGNSTDITKSPEGILWHAQHHQWLDPQKTGSILPENYPSSKLRAERARELLIKNYGNITLDVCKEILRDHEGGTDPNNKDSSDICRHADEDNLGFTIQSWIIESKKLTVYHTRGAPCKHNYINRDFSDIFS